MTDDKKPHELRSVSIGRMKPEEYAMLKQACELDRRNVSSFVLKAALDTAKKVVGETNES